MESKWDILYPCESYRVFSCYEIAKILSLRYKASEYYN